VEWVGIADGRLSNEDLFAFRNTVEAGGGQALLDTQMGGGDVTRRFGLGRTGDLGRLGAGDAILVVATDLHEEAPIWWLRVKRAAERGATLVVANARPTRTDDAARHRVRYEVGQAVETVLGLGGATESKGRSADVAAAGSALAQAGELVVFFGSEGLDLAGSTALSQACAVARGRRPCRKTAIRVDRSVAERQRSGAWDLDCGPRRWNPRSLRAAKARHRRLRPPVTM
jgi:NADH-quinone oxidoreductase subunit G